jgi:hypothetical protein
MRFRLPHLAFAVAALALAFGARAAQAMTFETVSGPEACAARTCVLATGEIGEQSGEAFAAFLHANRIDRGALVILNSPGGDLMASLKMGNEIRGAGLATMVAAFDKSAGRFADDGACASACAYVFLGGVERSVGAGAKIGVHQIYAGDKTWTMNAEAGFDLMSLVALHLQHLCGNLGLLIPTLKTRPQEMHWLSSSELTRYAVVTTGATLG